MADQEDQPAGLKPTSATSAAKTSNVPPAAADDDDSDPDFDDLDDVLDQFSANAPVQPKPSTTEQASIPTPSPSGPGRPTSSTSAPAIQNESILPTGQQPNESESDFIERLSKEMSSMLSALSADPSASSQSPEDIAKMGKELEEFTQQMEKEGIQPEDLLKALLGEDEASKIAEMAQIEREKQSEPPQKTPSTQPQPPPTESTTVASSSSSTTKPQPKSFEDTIRNTISRLGESDKSATTAAQKSTAPKSEEDLLAEMLRAMDGGGSGDPNDPGNSDGISKMFMDMMQQLTHKDLLYEPMKELHTQYPSWLDAHKSKLEPSELERYKRQSVIVAEITRKFEEPGFSDDDPQCREFIWEKMQKMQDEGAPPEELVKNPFPGTDFGGIPGMGGGGGDQLPEGLGKELEEGCPTQ